VPPYDEMIDAVVTAFGRQDLDALERWVQPDAVFDWSRSINDVRGVYEGLDGMRAALKRFFEPWDDVSWEVTGVTELADERLLVRTRVTGRGRSSGIEIEAEGAQVWKLRESRLARVTMYQGPEDALAAENPEAGA
jgi:ketosteroid isomerase-like protein